MSMAYFTPLSLNASVGHFALDMIPLDISAARTISLSSPAFPNSVKAKFWKLALTDTSDPNWPSPLGPDHNHNLSPNRPTGRRLFWKLALTRILDPNRSTAINFDDGRGNGLHPLKAKGELSGRGECPRKYVRWKMSGSPPPLPTLQPRVQLAVGIWLFRHAVDVRLRRRQSVVPRSSDLWRTNSFTWYRTAVFCRALNSRPRVCPLNETQTKI